MAVHLAGDPTWAAQESQNRASSSTSEEHPDRSEEEQHIVSESLLNAVSAQSLTSVTVIDAG